VDYDAFSWERQRAPRSSAELSADDIEIISRLLLELREITLSQASYLAATDFLRRFGFEADSHSLVRSEQLAH